MMKNKFWTIFYASAGVVTLSLVTVFAVWNGTAKKGGPGQEVIGTANLDVSPLARKEYIMGEKFDPYGLKLKYKDKTIDVTEANLTYDFTSSGRKEVKVFANEDGVKYQASYYVEVFGVINLDVSNYLSNITILEDGRVIAPDIKVVANLSGHANEFKKYEPYPQFEKTCFILKEGNYSISAVKSTAFENYYNVTVKAGASTFGFVYSKNETHPDVSSTDRMLLFTNETMNNRSLTLYVTYNSNAFTGLGPGKNTDVEGKYVLRNLSDSSVIGEYGFKYRVETWTSSFLSEATYHQGLTDSQGYKDDPNAMKVVVNGETYFAPGGSWHLAVLGE